MAGPSASAESLKDELMKVLETKMPDGQLNELKKYLKDDLISSIDLFKNHLIECVNMENLDSYANLENKIKEISQQKEKKFYIGYTGKISDYLWTTHAKMKEWEQAIKDGKLWKKKTYYIRRYNANADLENDEEEGESHKGEGGNKETEAALISRFGQHKRCLNGTNPGSSSETGIIYVLEYTEAP